MNRRELLLAMGAALCARRVGAVPDGLETAYVNANIWTGRSAAPHATAFGISGNRIAAVGDDASIRAMAAKYTHIVDLSGAFVMPGFIDNHTHFLRASFMLGTPELRTVKSRAEFVERVARAAADLRRGRWLQGGNWDEQVWGGELPGRSWIDAVTPDTPVAITRLDLHLVLLNSLALRLAAINRNTPDPEGGLIVRDARGEPTGLLKDKAIQLVDRVIPPPSDADIDLAITNGIAHALSMGVTQAHVTELDWVTHHALRRLRAKNGLNMRFYSFVPIEDWQKLDELVRTEGRGDDWVRWGGVKGLVDGSLGSRTALLHDPYADNPASHGMYRTPPDRLHEWIQGADAAGLHVTVHAIGDAANEQLLDMYAAVAARNGARDRRFRIEHAQHLLAKDIPRFAPAECHRVHAALSRHRRRSLGDQTAGCRPPEGRLGDTIPSRCEGPRDIWL